MINKKRPIIDEKDVQTLLENALINDGVLTIPKDISQMLINIKGVSINAKPRKDGRYQGYIIQDERKVYVYGKTREDVAVKLKEYLKNGLPKKKKADTSNEVPTTFNAFAQYYFENFRKKKVAELTFYTDTRRYESYLFPYFKEKPLKKITPKECQDLLDKISATGKGKTTDELHSLLSIIFKGAIKHGIINRNPLDIVFHVKHERKHGSALTIEEERLFKDKIQLCEDEKVVLGCLLVLYTGLRPNELKTAQVKDCFIIAQNSKRKNKKIEFKKIPIIKALVPFVENRVIPKYSERAIDKMRATVKEILPNHILYDLRTTFYTRCKEYGVSDVARDEFVGHSLGELGNTYTDLSDEYLINEGKKLDAWQ